MNEDITERIAHLNQQVARLYRAGQPTRAMEIAIQACDLAREHLDERHSAYRTSLEQPGSTSSQRGGL